MTIHDEFPRNFPTLTCLLSYPGNDDALHRLLSVHILISTSSLVIDRPQNLATDLQEQVMPKQNKEEMHKTRENFLHRPTYYHGEATMIKYCGYRTFVIRFYLHLCRVFLFKAKWSKISSRVGPSYSPCRHRHWFTRPLLAQEYYGSSFNGLPM